MRSKSNSRRFVDRTKEERELNRLTDKYVNPLTDFGFKKLFGSEPNKVLLIDFLNQILPDRQIKDLSYSSGEKLGKTEMDRKAVFDLYCIGDEGERFRLYAK